MKLFNDTGMIFPWAAGLAAILFILLSSSLFQYKNQIIATKVYESHIREQHLLSVAETQFVQVLSKNYEEAIHTPFIVSTPDGKATASCMEEQEDSIECEWSLTPLNKDTKIIKTYYQVK
ncbi:hypothetical protein [Halobacillus mangrovi]|uniref:Competence protein ComG n=1 Tax=Halobacillus mangrovi TaxID=402384 RepID=A0A1W5ZUV5_9BACI|nr:hypothetical protein [Halobacillus mangrovi]ARI77068.1 hypothetical protein HM131_09560 [Halobacillus mangrovi]